MVKSEFFNEVESVDELLINKTSVVAKCFIYFSKCLDGNFTACSGHFFLKVS